jgi:hypothetical protein
MVSHLGKHKSLKCIFELEAFAAALVRELCETGKEGAGSMSLSVAATA